MIEEQVQEEIIGLIKEDKVMLDKGRDLFDNNWYGEIENGKVVLGFLEAAYLYERKRVKVRTNIDVLPFKDFFNMCSKMDSNFIAKYNVYKDLRERGLVVKIGFKGCDFRVYERGASPIKAKKVKWIVFCSSEDTPCQLEQLGKAIRLAKNIKSEALWAVCDNDVSMTYYCLTELIP